MYLLGYVEINIFFIIDSSKQRNRPRKKVCKEKSQLKEKVKCYNVLAKTNLSSDDIEDGSFPWSLPGASLTGTLTVK